MKNKIKKVICPNCRGDFIQKRRNQKYCHSGCRIEFNNEKNNEKRIILNKKQKPLAKNYDILSEILGDSKETKVHRQFLRGTGFNFSVFTHTDRNHENDNPCYGCHEFKYYKIDNEYYKIIRYD